MLQSWQIFLATQGAQFVLDANQCATAITHFEPSAPQETVLVDLSHFGLMHFGGEDAALFLNGQLSSDIKNLGVDQNQYSSYSTPKGRILANFLIWQQENGYVLQLPAELMPALQKRLSMFIMRSKVRVNSWAQTPVMMGLAGPQAATAIAALFDGLTLAPHQTACVGAVTVLRTTEARYQITVPEGAAPAVWQALAAFAQPAGEVAWALSEIRAGSPWITLATQEAFVPQMANLDLTGGVSFTKGCYTGQEIVARTQYLGKLKRRTFRIALPVAAEIGDALYSVDMNGQASGLIVNIAPADTGFEALAVIQLGALEHGLHLQHTEGPVVSLLSLPYALDVE